MFLKPSDRHNFSLKLTDLPLFLRIQVLNNIGDRVQRQRYDALKPIVEPVLRKLSNNDSYLLPATLTDLFHSIYEFSAFPAPEYLRPSTRDKFKFQVDLDNFHPSSLDEFNTFSQYTSAVIEVLDRCNTIPSYRSVAAVIIGWLSAEIVTAKIKVVSDLAHKNDHLAVTAYGDALYENYLVSNHLLPDVEKHLFGIYSNVIADRTTGFIMAHVSQYEQFKNYFEHLSIARTFADLNPFHYFYLGYNQKISTSFHSIQGMCVHESIIGECTNRFMSLVNYDLENLKKTDDAECVRDMSAIGGIREACWAKLLNELYQERSVASIEHTGTDFYTLIAEQEFVVENIAEYIRRKTMYVPTKDEIHQFKQSPEAILDTDKFLDLDQARKALMALAGIQDMNDARTMEDICLTNVLEPNIYNYRLSQEFIEKIGFAVYYIEKYLRIHGSTSKLRTDDLLSTYLEVEKLDEPFFFHPVLTTCDSGLPLLSHIYGMKIDSYLHFEIFLKSKDGKRPEPHLCISEDLIAEIFE